MNDMIDDICNIAQNLKDEGLFKEASVLYSVITDLAIHEERRYIRSQLAFAFQKMKKLSTKLSISGHQHLANEADVIAKDIESRMTAFSVDSPIESVLHSYKVIHRLAQNTRPTNNVMQEVRDLVESELIPDSELPKHIKQMTLGLTEQEKRDILYMIEKDYNLSIPVEKIAKKTEKEEKQAEEDKCLEKAFTPEERAKCLEGKEPKLKMERSWPSAPSMWSGFAYEAVVPYHQNNQLNFWSIASDEEKVLKRIARTK